MSAGGQGWRVGLCRGWGVGVISGVMYGVGGAPVIILNDHLF